MRWVALAVFVFISAAVAIKPLQQHDDFEVAQELFEKFVKDFNKEYSSLDERAYRFNVFRDNLKVINKFNSAKSGAAYGITKFADVDPEEFGQRYLMKNLPEKLKQKSHLKEEQHVALSKATKDLPTKFDWRDKDAVTPVYDQQTCGSCWAFSTAETIESQWFLAGHNLTQLSMQQIIDCDLGNGDEGCNGGDTPTAYEYVMKTGGLESFQSYPYADVDQKCQFESSRVVATISNWTYVTTTKNETEMLHALYNQGPLSICVDAASWQFYVGGVINALCGTSLDHCVQITGFGEERNIIGKKVPVWNIRNSWGSSWGEEGYLWVVCCEET